VSDNAIVVAIVTGTVAFVLVLWIAVSLAGIRRAVEKLGGIETRPPQ